MEHHYKGRNPGCHTPACDHHVGVLWAKHYAKTHKPKTTITQFDLCVANRENGEPSATSFSSINWKANNNYEGAFSWEHSKWVAGGGLKYANHPYDATPQEQVAVFHQNGRNGEWTASNWPTIPPCSGYAH